MSRRPATKRPAVYRYNQSQAQRQFTVPTSRLISVSLHSRRLQETNGAPLLQYLDEDGAFPSWKTLTDDLYANQDVWENVHDIEESPSSAEAPGKPTAKRYANSDAPMLEWMGTAERAGHREEYLREFLRAEGRGLAPKECCPSCVDIADDMRDWDNRPVIRCDECGAGLVECVRCCLRRHARMVLHRIKRWNGTFFEDDSLKRLGLRVQLGHWDMHCINPRPGPSDFTVLHINGIHKVAIDFCACEHRRPDRVQCLRFNWYPATTRAPRTCATIEMLQHFHIQTLCGKISAYEYYRGLNNASDNTDIDLPKTRYRSFFRMNRQFRHLKLMKWAGRGLVYDGIATSGAGDLAIRCISCPHPDENLQEGWDLVPTAKKYIYRPIVGGDACFRLKNVKKSTHERDPGLHMGLAYYVDHEAYIAHVKKYATQKDISSCSGFRTLADAETKNNKGLRATGIGMFLCARHEFILPAAVGDLQIGERYCNMDYLAGSAIKHSYPNNQEVFFSYDIACQWRKKLGERMQKLPEQSRIRPDIVLDFGVPKLHCKAHKYACQCQYSMNLKPGVARTDGEGIERTWDDLRTCAPSTKEMGPGARFDTIDDQMGGHNWRKVTGTGHLMHQRYDLAVKQHARQAAAHIIFTECLPIGKNWAQEWTVQVEAWEADNNAPNPYFREVKHASEAVVKHRLKEQERRAEEKGATRLHAVGPAVMVAMGLLLEDKQRRLIQDYKETEEDPLTVSDLNNQQKQRTALQREVKQFRGMQAAYMPCVAPLLLDSPARIDGTVDIEHECLFLPSALTPAQRTEGCRSGLPEIEEKLREAQCMDSLETLRGLIRTKRDAYRYRDGNMRGQVHMTRAAGFVDRLQHQLDSTVAKYRASRAALLSLRGFGPWEKKLQLLKDSDLDCMDGAVFSIDVGDGTEDDPTRSRKKRRMLPEQVTSAGEGHRTVGWIWTLEGAFGGDDKELAARLEWLKSRARLHRWWEQVNLLKAEMSRTLISLEKRAVRWDDWRLGCESLVGDTALLEGRQAYASSQAAVYRNLAASFGALWKSPASSVIRPARNEEEALEMEAREETLAGEHTAETAEDDYVAVSV